MSCFECRDVQMLRSRRLHELLKSVELSEALESVCAVEYCVFRSESIVTTTVDYLPISSSFINYGWYGDMRLLDAGR